MADDLSRSPSSSNGGAYSPTALPSVGARVLGFVAILLAGFCGGVIGYAFVDLQCTEDCGLWAGIGAFVGAVIGAVGVAVVVTLAFRAMGEWRTIQHSEGSEPDTER